LGLNTQTLSSTASTITNRPPRATKRDVSGECCEDVNLIQLGPDVLSDGVV
jgi:hypothetical protein